MTANDEPPIVRDDERLARYILFSKWIRVSDNTIKSDAFTPFPWPDLSVTRHEGLNEEDLWEKGQSVAHESSRTLHGRADVSTVNVRDQSLQVEAAPIKNNQNHANITGWPPTKPLQKIIAQVIAAHSTYFRKP